jgi:D-3-phosphoglycerate dehydrogenase
MPACLPPLVILSDPSIHRAAVALLERHCSLRILKAYSPEEAFAEASAEASAILARLGTVTRRVIEASPGLRIIARHGVGLDAVDLAAATERGVVVTSTGSANAAAVAEYSFALLLSLVRRTALADSSMRAGQWARDPLVGMELDGRTIGIIGLGAIGARVARQALGFGMKVLAARSQRPQRLVEGVVLVPLDELLARSDAVSLHLRLSTETAGVLDAGRIAAMRPGALLVNTARGELIDETAMIRALESGHLGGAALDTYAEEPLPSASPLRMMPNVVLSPHVAGQTAEAVERVGLAAAQAILDELSGRRAANVHNEAAYEVRRRRGLFATSLLRA